MDERRAREVTLVEAFETTSPASDSWREEDRAWADRVAREAAPGGGDLDSFVAERARHAMHRLGEREPQLAKSAIRPGWRAGALAVVVLVAFILGIAADAIGASRRIDLLAPPLWGVMVWNLVVYVVLIVAPLLRLAQRRPLAAGPIARWMQRLAEHAVLPRFGAGKVAAARGFATLWEPRSRRLSLLRAETLLHAGAAAIGAGLVAGLYARGLVLDYRAVWESTLLGAATAHALVVTVFAPASLLSGIALPDAAAFASMRDTAGAPAVGAPAAPWLHLLALTIAIVVIVPRTLLALGCGAAAAWRARAFPLPLETPYFQRLARLGRGGAAHVVVHPYAATPTPQGTLGLRALLAEALGSRVELRVAPLVAFGGEDEALAANEAATTHAIVLFDLGATPEREQQGRFVERVGAALPRGAALAVVVDASAFARRFAGLDTRVAQRREAWRTWAEATGVAAVVVDLEAADAATSGPLLEAAFVAVAKPS